MNVERFHGIFAATVCPMHPDASIDEAALKEHIAHLAMIGGLTGFLINGHAGENFTLTSAEKRMVLGLAREAAGERLVIAGVNQESSTAAVDEAEAAATAGADAILLFPPFSWALALDPPVVLAHHEAVAAATDLPLFLYHAPVGAGALAYPPTILEALLRLPTVAGIKEGSWETAAYEANRRLVKSLRPEVRVMASGDEHLLTCFLLGSDGSQVSLAALIPGAIVALERAVAAADLAAAKEAHAVIYPLAKAIYGTAPGSRATARLKWALCDLGRIPNATMRPPIQPLDQSETTALKTAMRAAGLG